MTEHALSRTLPYRWSVLGLLFYALYVAGLAFPNLWWGTHFVRFLPPAPRYLFLLLPLVLLARPTSSAAARILASALLVRLSRRPSVVALLLAACCFGVFVLLPAPIHLYGDSATLLRNTSPAADHFQSAWLVGIFSPDIFVHNNHDLFVVNIARVTSYLLQVEPRIAFQVLSAICGALFVFLWVWFVHVYFADRTSRTLLTVVGLLPGFTQLFLGHCEIYAVSMVSISIYLIVTLMLLRTSKPLWAWLLPFAFLLCVKSHTINFLLVPVLALTLAYHFSRNRPDILRYFTWRYLAVFLLLPGLIAFIIVYVFVIQNHNAPLNVLPELASRTPFVFLPVVPSAPPLDRYTLQSLWHVFDFVNIMMLWTPAGLAIILGIALFRPKQVDWNHPSVLVTGFALILYAAFFFATNPKLSMPRDWDLFSLPAPCLLFFCAALLAQRQNDVRLHAGIAGPVLGLCILCIPMFIVNGNRDLVARRLEHVGVYVYNTYCEGSSYIINSSMRMQSKSRDEMLGNRLRNIALIKPRAKGNNYPYADLHNRIGVLYLDSGRPDLARGYFETACAYYPGEEAMTYNLAVAYYGTGDLENTARCLAGLFTMGSESPAVLKLAAFVAFDQGRYDAAYRYGRRCLEMDPRDREMRRLLEEVREQQ